jgi:GNAT superfamily N-acetyltransferase
MVSTTSRIPAEVVVLKSRKELDSVAPKLAQLSANTEMDSYGVDQWKYLLHAGDVSALVVPADDDDDKLLGCILQIGYGKQQSAAYGMMLVSPAARGRGLARQLLEAAMSLEPNDGMHILGTCTQLGAPMYEKMGFRRVGNVTKLTIPWDQINFGASSANAQEGETTQVGPSTEFFDDFLKLDSMVTGLDRSSTLSAIMSYPQVCIATAMKDGELIAGAMATRSGNSVVVGPILGKEPCVLPLVQAIVNFHRHGSDVSILVSDHPSLVDLLTENGFQVAFELGAMTMDGMLLPGSRDGYLALIHPTLG